MSSSRARPTNNCASSLFGPSPPRGARNSSWELSSGSSLLEGRGGTCSGSSATSASSSVLGITSGCSSDGSLQFRDLFLCQKRCCPPFGSAKAWKEEPTLDPTAACRRNSAQITDAVAVQLRGGQPDMLGGRCLCTCMCACMRTCMRTCMCSCMCSCMCTCMSTGTGSPGVSCKAYCCWLKAACQLIKRSAFPSFVRKASCSSPVNL